MNPITLVTILCLAYSVAALCRTDGKLVYHSFKDLPEKHKALLQKYLNKTFENDDILLDYKKDDIGYFPGTYVSFPAIILRQHKRPIFYLYKYEDYTAERIPPGEFINYLYSCEIPSESEYTGTDDGDYY